MINKISKRISLPKQTTIIWGYQPKGNSQMGHLPLFPAALFWRQKWPRPVSTAAKGIPRCFVKVIKITLWSIPPWVTPWTVLFFLARRVTVRQSWTSNQYTSRQHFPSLHFRPCLFLFWQETGDDNTVAQTSRGCLQPAARLSSCGRGHLFLRGSRVQTC